MKTPKWTAVQDSCPDNDRDVFVWCLIDGDLVYTIGALYSEDEGSGPFWHLIGSESEVTVLAWAEIP
jgi:hypothetical protein